LSKNKTLALFNPCLPFGQLRGSSAISNAGSH
jgi:hypothetical protein